MTRDDTRRKRRDEDRADSGAASAGQEGDNVAAGASAEALDEQAATAASSLPVSINRGPTTLATGDQPCMGAGYLSLRSREISARVLRFIQTDEFATHTGAALDEMKSRFTEWAEGFATRRYLSDWCTPRLPLRLWYAPQARRGGNREEGTWFLSRYFEHTDGRRRKRMRPDLTGEKYDQRAFCCLTHADLARRFNTDCGELYKALGFPTDLRDLAEAIFIAPYSVFEEDWRAVMTNREVRQQDAGRQEATARRQSAGNVRSMLTRMNELKQVDPDSLEFQPPEVWAAFATYLAGQGIGLDGLTDEGLNEIYGRWRTTDDFVQFRALQDQS